MLEFDALAVEGGLLPPEWLAKVAALDAPAQAAADYRVPKGLELRDEITRYWRIAEALWHDYASASEHTAGDAEALTHSFVTQLLTQVFGFTDLADGGRQDIDGRLFDMTFEARAGRVPVIAGVPGESLDAPTARHAPGGRRRSAWATLQEYLNASDEALWGIATNGLVLRIGRDNTSLTRPAWIEADLERIFGEELFADFSVLWLLLHASRFGQPDRDASECALEAWRDKARDAGTRARDQLRDGVERALLALGQGFLAHPANVALRDGLRAGDLAPIEYFNELLRLVYRMIFLLTIEEREILHGGNVSADTRALYREGYGMRRLRDRAVRRSQYDRHTDLWASLAPVFAALGHSDGEPALGLPALGGLFAPGQCPHLDSSTLENRSLLDAVFRLAWLREPTGLARVNWKDMGFEELGSIYESLLELVPRVDGGARSFDFLTGDEAAGSARKLTGSYYTPDVLVQQLLDTALEPGIEERLAASPQDREGALLSITVIDPACGSGHFLLAAARRLAMHLARIRTGGTPGAEEFRHATRDVVTHCIHGVDRNPMALELARTGLWLETFTPDRALGFLDHHLVCGDALLGLLDLGVLGDGIPDDAFKALTGDDKEVVRTLKKVNRGGRKALENIRKHGALTLQLGTEDLAAAFDQLDRLSDDAVDSVEAKRARYDALRADAEEHPYAVAADIYLGAFLIPKRPAPGEEQLTERAALDRFPQTGALFMALEGSLGSGHTVAKAAREVCREAHVLHWPLAFPQVFERGGFDVVLGNPPWERMKLQEQEFFAVRDPAIAKARNKAERERAIGALARAPEGSPERALYAEFMDAKQQSEASSAFCHTEARYPLTGVGDVNTYALFAETAYRLIASRGRAGLVLPTGIATDDWTKQFFGDVVESARLVSLYDFENRERLFQAVDGRQKFCLFTIGRALAAEFAFFLTQVHQLSDARRRFELTAEDFRLINPNTRTCPIFRSRQDAELTKKIYRNVPVVIDETKPDAEGNPWGLSFMRMFDMSNDSGLFLDEPAEDALPLYEAKFIGQFDHRRGSYESRGDERGYRVLPDTSLEQYSDPAYSITPFYWVNRAAVDEKLGSDWPVEWLIGFKRITAATNQRTMVATIIPRAAVGDSLFLIQIGPATAPGRVAALIANLNCLTFDYAARQKLGGLNLNFYIVKQCPVLPRSRFSEAGLEFIIPRVLELTYTAWDLKPWALDLGYTGPPFAWDPDRRAVIRAELDAYFARLYGLTRDELRYILDPADVMGPDYPSETFRVLKANEERQYGEYRTRRLVLEAWDRLEAQQPRRHVAVRATALQSHS